MQMQMQTTGDKGPEPYSYSREMKNVIEHHPGSLQILLGALGLFVRSGARTRGFLEALDQAEELLAF
jgi:hypothetical protein